ncbi:glycine betaine ABC transporter substrate-binding protein [Candidatus Nitronereus thalassa]|uniref:Glycine betaine ABC transporter substrate-binding protein n=1 Tax=Candidatus Nitronereus thalassa TaxID=3020898 RepID=A0ABU3K786_9BACT|nr:glycine betaine ABC transporter substrate-binding protein [Candidatus Nitronereus thalassa]MDT7042251.1 glycine betaine ABC transporter substrate-binding protein [Candidatus Nitronereus thalassa]
MNPPLSFLGRRMGAVIFLVFSFLLPFAPPAFSEDNRIVIGSKNFMENKLLAEVFAQLIEARTDLQVERRFGLAGTQVCFEALLNGAIDLYPEYTGTGLVSILQFPPTGDSRTALNTVRAEFLKRWDLWWLNPLGFENSYALAVTRSAISDPTLRTISDLAKISSSLRAGLGYEFIKRPDGLPGLERRYGLSFQHVQAMQQSLKYQAAANGNIDVLDVYTTDGRLSVYDFVVLEDDQHFFPPYEASGVIRGLTLEHHPQLGAVLGLLSNAFDAKAMQQLNFRLQEGGEPLEIVARDALSSIGLLGTDAATPDAGSRQDALLPYLWENWKTLMDRTFEHLTLAGLALGLGIFLAVPLGLLLERRPSMAEHIIRGIGLTQTIPSIALLAFMIPVFGIGMVPAVMALWIYSLFPIVRNTYSGLRDAAPQAVESSRALGMTEWQILKWVRLPLAAPVIMAGIRTAGVITVGTTTLAAFIGAGGLGVPIVAGLQMANTTIILSGALPAAVLALVIDGSLSKVEHWVRPRGLHL